MRKRFLVFNAAVLVALLPTLVRADIILDSHAGLDACLMLSASVCGSTIPSVVTGVHPAWQQLPVTNPGDSTDNSAKWIGAVDSGYKGLVFLPQNLSFAAYRIMSETFTTNASGGTLKLNVWADDSVDVFLNNMTSSTTLEISPLSTTGQNPPCSGQIVSCTPVTEGLFTVALAPSTTYRLSFDVWQTGSDLNTTLNPTALLYTGKETNTCGPGEFCVPDGGTTALLLSFALMGVGLVSRRIK